MNPLTRLRWFHGLFGFAFLAAYFTGDDGELLHIWLGYSLLILLLLRLLVARFRIQGFPVLWPSYRPGMVMSMASRSLVLALLLSVSVTVVTGLMMVDNARVLGLSAATVSEPSATERSLEESTPQFFPQLEEVLEEVHEVAANSTLGLVGLHISLLLAFRRRFALSMIPGLATLAQYSSRFAAKAASAFGLPSA